MPSLDRIAGLVGSGVARLFVVSLVVNVLLLVQPLYMLQVYDRVLASASLDTLLFISLMAGGAILLLGLVDALRGVIAGRIGTRIGIEGGQAALHASLAGPRAALGDVQPLRDLAAVRGFVGGKALLGFLDLPFAPLFVAILYLIHPDLFWLTAGGAAILLAVAVLNQWLSERSLGRAGEDAIGAGLMAQSFARSSESIRAMGMAHAVTQAWGRREASALALQGTANQMASAFGGVSRVLRLGLQIAILGYGGYLVLAGEMTAGMIFAASLISGRALQSIDGVIGGWSAFADVRKACGRLRVTLPAAGQGIERTALPEPKGRVEIAKVVVAAPGASRAEPILKGISATIPAGECVVLIGASGAGKSTLARAIVGAVTPRDGTVRLDGADLRQWDPEALGRHVGYLAQDVDMLPGTVAQNIARFDCDADHAAIVAAARTAQAHDLVLALPNGYDTVLGPEGVRLSGGQRQRIGLARAFFGSPRLLVLDEPNAHLDAAGEQALDGALAAARQAGTTVVIVTQRKLVADRADRVLVLRDGLVEDYGTRAELMARQAERARAGAPVPEPRIAQINR